MFPLGHLEPSHAQDEFDSSDLREFCDCLRPELGPSLPLWQAIARVALTGLVLRPDLDGCVGSVLH